jgi:hypothetical protein
MQLSQLFVRVHLECSGSRLQARRHSPPAAPAPRKWCHAHGAAQCGSRPGRPAAAQGKLQRRRRRGRRRACRPCTSGTSLRRPACCCTATRDRSARGPTRNRSARGSSKRPRHGFVWIIIPLLWKRRQRRQHWRRRWPARPRRRVYPAVGAPFTRALPCARQTIGVSGPTAARKPWHAGIRPRLLIVPSLWRRRRRRRWRRRLGRQRRRICRGLGSARLRQARLVRALDPAGGCNGQMQPGQYPAPHLN